MENKKTLYIEGASGISGDMFVGAMIDLGADLEVLEAALDSIPVDGFGVDVARVKKAGIDCVDFDVALEEENHDHDMAYLYGSAPDTEENAAGGHEETHGCCGGHGKDGASCGCHGEEGHTCCHGHHHGDHHHEDHEAHGHGCCGHYHQEEQGHHHHHGRHLPEIQAIIEATDMTSRAKELANRIFRIVAEAEAKAHRLPVEEVHFHEVGAVDSIVDIISAAVCFDNLGITDVIIPELREGRGTVRCQHGVLPVPVPATSYIAEAYGLPLSIMDAEGEFITPTGAAIAAAIRTESALPRHFKIKAVGLGAGKRDYTTPPPFLRAMLIEADAREEETDTVTVLATDIDDSTGEALGYVLEKLMAAGAKDAHYTPVYMKKNRPAWELTVLCTPEQAGVMKRILFTETTTIGIREMDMRRTVLPRTAKTVDTPLGEAQVKCCVLGGGERCYPEYESVRQLAEENGIAFIDAYRIVQAAAEE